MADKSADKAISEPVIISFAEIKVPVAGLKLNIGSGDHLLNGFINIDKFNRLADAPWDAGHLPLNDNSVALIVSTETIEHFGRDEIEPIFREWYRVLKPQGEAHIATPDIHSSFKLALEHKDDDWYLARVFGNQSHGGQFHKWGFTPKNLNEFLGFAGFSQCVVGNLAMPDGAIYLYFRAIK
jgi:predicted SAM-dependent methyltransferase